jgi:hypothetical protein
VRAETISRSARLERLIRSPPPALAWLALAALLVAAAALLLYETRGTTFWTDEWAWLVERRDPGLDTLLEPHNEHLSLVPLVLYNALFELVGADTYLPYRLAVIAAHLGVAVLVYVYAGRRLGAVLGLLAAALMLFLGPGWQNFMWGFQVAWLISLAAGVGAFLLLDRGDRAGALWACVLVGVALASSGVGVPIALGLAVELLWRRRREVWVVAAPLLLYAVWWLAYTDSELIRHALVLTPSFMASAAAGVLSSLVGLSGMDPPADGAALTWGRPLAVAGVAALAWRLARLRSLPPRVLALLTILLSFWFLTGVRRSVISSPDASRYVYVGALFVVLLAAELARGVAISVRATLVLVAAVGVVTLSNVGVLRDAGRLLRSDAEVGRSVLGAVEVARPATPPDHVAIGMPAYPFVQVRAGPYLEMADELGSPAASPAEIAASSEAARVFADAELLRIHEVELEPSDPGSERLAGAPALGEVAEGSASARGACVRYRPAAFRRGEGSPRFAVTVPPGGVRVTTGPVGADVRLRRFAEQFPADPYGRLAPSSSTTLRIGRDSEDRPWHLQLTADGPVSACGLG